MLFIHFKTLFSFKFYHRLTQLSTLHTVAFAIYLYILSVIVLFFFTGSMIKNNLPMFLKNFPQITFENGMLTAPDKPVYAPIPRTDFKIVFDASAQLPPSNDELLNNNTLAWVHKNQLYIPSSSGLQQQTLPDTLNFTSTPEIVEKYKGALGFSLRVAFFVVSLLMLAILLACNYCLTLGVVLFFNLWKGRPLPRAELVKLAVFLLGPLTTLFLIRLWVNIPLFALAQTVLCIIYAQQIFNLLPEARREN